MAWEVAGYFCLALRDAGRVIDQVRRAVANWREAALEFGIGRGEVESMAVAFSE